MGTAPSPSSGKVFSLCSAVIASLMPPSAREARESFELNLPHFRELKCSAPEPTTQ